MKICVQLIKSNVFRMPSKLMEEGYWSIIIYDSTINFCEKRVRLRLEISLLLKIDLLQILVSFRLDWEMSNTLLKCGQYERMFSFQRWYVCFHIFLVHQSKRKWRNDSKCKIWAKRFFLVLGICVTSAFRTLQNIIKPFKYIIRICNYVRIYKNLVQHFLWLIVLHMVSEMHFHVAFCFSYFFKYLFVSDW